MADTKDSFRVDVKENFMLVSGDIGERFKMLTPRERRKASTVETRYPLT